MEISRRRPLLWSLPLSVILIFLNLILPTEAVYFYIENASPKCFYEELPKDTLVVGLSPSTFFCPILPSNTPTKDPS